MYFHLSMILIVLMDDVVIDVFSYSVVHHFIDLEDGVHSLIAVT